MHSVSSVICLMEVTGQFQMCWHQIVIFKTFDRFFCFIVFLRFKIAVCYRYFLNILIDFYGLLFYFLKISFKCIKLLYVKNFSRLNRSKYIFYLNMVSNLNLHYLFGQIVILSNEGYDWHNSNCTYIYF